MELKDRLLEVIKERYDSQAKFADELGKKRQTLNQVLKNGSPSFTFLQQLKEKIPDLNFNWLLFGEGDRYLSAGDFTYNMVKENIDRYSKYTKEDHLFFGQMRDEIDFLREQIRSMRPKE